MFWETKKHIRHSPTTPLFTIPISLRKRLDRKKCKQGLFLKGHTFLSIFHLFPTLLYIIFFFSLSVLRKDSINLYPKASFYIYVVPCLFTLRGVSETPSMSLIRCVVRTACVCVL